MTAFQRAQQAFYEVVDGRAVVVDPSGSGMVTLNPVGSLVWEALDGMLDVDGLTDRLGTHFPDVPRATLRRDVDAFVDELRANGLIELSTPSPS